MSTEEKLDSKPKRRRWRRGQEEEAVEAAVEAEEAGEAEDEDTGSLTTPKGRATPGRRQQQVAEEARGNAITRPLYRLADYWRDVRSELNKVSWPTREETIQLTRIVLLTTIISAIVLGVITLLFTELFRLGLGQPLIFIGLFVVVVALVVMFLRRGDQRSTY